MGTLGRHFSVSTEKVTANAVIQSGHYTRQIIIFICLLYVALCFGK